VAVCVVLGGLLVSRVSDTTEIWALRADVRAGEPVQVDDLERVDARLDGTALARYLTAEDGGALVDRAATAVWGRDMVAGELVPDAALVSSSSGGGVELPLQVSQASVPADLGEGHQVDVWVAPGESGVEPSAEARRVLDDVTVVAVAGSDTAWGDASTRGVVVRVDDDSDELLPRALAALESGTVTLVRRTAAGS